jgi:hypothetical protein
MDDFLKIILGVLCLLILFQVIYSYITFSSFSCPDCPECPACDEKKEDIVPTNKVLTNYIVNKFIDQIDDDTKSIDFLKQYVLFANNYKVNFELDAESIMSKIRKEVDDPAIQFIEKNLRYIQSTDAIKKDQFNKQYALNEYPSPLIYFEGSNILFGYLNDKEKWMILLDVTKI